MKKTAIRFISIILVIVALFGNLSLIASAEVKEKYPYDCPIIYIYGQGCPLYKNHEDGTVERVYPLEGDNELGALLGNLIKEKGDVFAKAFITQDWTEFSYALADVLEKAYEPIQLDKNGNSDPTVKKDYDISLKNAKERKKDRSGLSKFDYNIDWRLDPFENAKELRLYIGYVLKATGAKKYSIVSRCEGSNVALAYWQKYKDPRIKNLCFYSAAVNGASAITEGFSGKLDVDALAVERFLYEADLVEKNSDLAFINDVIRKVVKMLTDTYGLDVVTWAFKNVYTQIYPVLIPRILSVSFATFPGFWAMVSANDYDDAMKLLYGGKEKEYAGLIAKCDYYHKNVSKKVNELLLEAKKKGVRVTSLVKYGSAPLPIVDNYNDQTDTTCSVYDASFGATSTLCGETFGKEYLEKAKKKGTDKYIGVDKCIDASTCLFPDTTWFLKNNIHSDYNDSIEVVLWKILDAKNITVFDDSTCPQYLFYHKEDGCVEPLKAHHKTKMDEYYDKMAKSLFRKHRKLWKPLFEANVFMIETLMLPTSIE